MYSVVVFHAGRHVATEIVKAKSYEHAHRLAAYITRTLALHVVPLAEFDADEVSWVVED